MTKIDSKNSLSPLRHFTEQLVGVFGKLPRENDLDNKSSKLLIRWLKSTTRIQPATNHTQPETEKLNQKSKTPTTQAILTLRMSTAPSTT
jgi:hypothetical protein